MWSHEPVQTLLSALSSNVTRRWIIGSEQVSGPRTCVKLSYVTLCSGELWRVVKHNNEGAGDVGIVINVSGNIWPSMTMGRWGQGKLSWHSQLLFCCQCCQTRADMSCLNGVTCWVHWQEMDWTVLLNILPARRNDPDNQTRTSRGVTGLWRHDGALRSSYSRSLVTFNLNWLLTTAPFYAMTSTSIIRTLGPLIGLAGLWHGHLLVTDLV